jgi:hypothetical protein
MRKIIIIAMLLFAGPALAQAVQPAEVMALSGQLIDQMQQTLSWRTRAISDEQKIADLQAQLEKCKK